MSDNRPSIFDPRPNPALVPPFFKPQPQPTPAPAPPTKK